MTAPFNWAGLWRKTADVFKKHGENIAATTIDDMDQAAAAYLRTRIEAAFVPVESNIQIADVTARAEAAEAENTRLRDVIKRASDAPMLDHSGQQRGVYDILRQALGVDNT